MAVSTQSAVRRGQRSRVRAPSTASTAGSPSGASWSVTRITDADLLLYVQLVRFDLVAVPLGRLTRKRLVDHPHLWAYARDLYQRPAFRETTDFDHVARGTFGTGAGIRTQPDRARDARRRLGRAARSRLTSAAGALAKLSS